MVIRKAAALYIAVIIVLLAPAFVSAQGLFGLGSPWSPGLLSGPASGFNTGGANCCPALYLGYEISQGPNRKPAHFDLDITGSPDGTTAFTVNASEPGGLWLGISNYCQLSDRIGIMFSGWYLFPVRGDASETYTVAGVGQVGNRTWLTNRSWGWLDGALLLGSPTGLNLIAGFRWDSYSIKLTDPSQTSADIAVRGTPLDESDITLNSYMPFIGTQYSSDGPCCGLLFRVIGFPWVPGTINWGETGFVGPGTRLQINTNYKSSYFLEVFSEYSRNFGSFGCVGIFARWNYLYFNGQTDPQILGFTPAPPPPPPFIGDEPSPIRSSWTIGGRASINFNCPF